MKKTLLLLSISSLLSWTLYAATTELLVTAQLTETNTIKRPSPISQKLDDKQDLRKFGLQVKGAPSSMIQIQYTEQGSGKKQTFEQDHFLNKTGNKTIQIVLSEAPARDKNLVVQLNY